MFDISLQGDGAVKLTGRFDASQADTARRLFADVSTSCVVDFSELAYISSAGLGVLLEVQKRLNDGGKGLTLARMSPHVRQIFEYAGFHHIFTIE